MFRKVLERKFHWTHETWTNLTGVYRFHDKVWENTKLNWKWIQWVPPIYRRYRPNAEYTNAAKLQVTVTIQNFNSKFNWRPFRNLVFLRHRHWINFSLPNMIGCGLIYSNRNRKSLIIIIGFASNANVQSNLLIA